MIDFNLSTIDWTAIGSIGTLVALVFAYRSIHETNIENKKNRDLQIRLLKRSYEQTKLDRLVDLVLEINKSIKPIDLINTSTLVVNKTISMEKQHQLEDLASLINNLNTRIKLELTQYSNDKALSLLNKVFDLQDSFTLVSSNMNLLSKLFNERENFDSNNPLICDMLAKMVDRMVQKILQLDQTQRESVTMILKQNHRTMDQACSLFNIFGPIVAMKMQSQEKEIEELLTSFVNEEQVRIDRIVES